MLVVLHQFGVIFYNLKFN